MKEEHKKYILWAAIFVAVLLLIALFVGRYNSMVTREMNVEGKWAQVEAQYQLRMDRIPNLVSTVKGYAQHEQQTLQQVTEARTTATQIKLTAGDLTPENLQRFQAAQQQLSQGIGRLMAIGESYPELKASTNFLALQDEVAGTENRITKARADFNAAVQDYNAYIRKFPTNIMAGVYGFGPKAFFEAQEGAQTAPTIQF